MTPRAITVAIPTYRREAVLLASIEHLLEQHPAEILVVDQTPEHEPATQVQLAAWHAQGAIRWLRLPAPSVTAAMNRALLEAAQPVVLFVDDDIVPEHSLLAAHCAAHAAHPALLVAGRVLQPWDEGREHRADAPFHFAHPLAQPASEFIGANFSLPRDDAVAIGGFDENFVRVAYRYEAEFAARWLASGRRLHFEPEACVHHLKLHDGGTRSFGHHLTTWRGDHAVGAYYWALRTRHWREFARRPWRSVTTRFHLAHPWRIAPTLAAELGGMLWALKLYRAGPRHIAGAAKP